MQIIRNGRELQYNIEVYRAAPPKRKENITIKIDDREIQQME